MSLILKVAPPDNDLPRCLLHEELQTVETPACGGVVSGHGSAVRLHSRCCADRQQPVEDALAAEAGCQVQWGGASRILVLRAHGNTVTSLFLSMWV